MASRTFELLRDLEKPPIHGDESSKGQYFNFAGWSVQDAKRRKLARN
jgi:hypothetical protein